MMRTIKFRVILFSFLLTSLLLVACRPVAIPPGEGGATNAPGISGKPADGTVIEPVVGLANPAAVYCQGLGYQLERRENAAGEDAACIFPNGEACGQWDFLSGRCGQEYSYCRQQGGILLAEEANFGACLLSDGSTCDEFSYFSDECRPGDSGQELSAPTPAAGAQPSVEEEAAALSQDNAEEAGITPVVGWMGYVVITAAGAQFDDYVVILPEGEVGEFGIEGVDEALREQIVALRDREQPGMYAHFWGQLTCEVMDYGGCQLLVERLWVDGPGDFFEPDLVAGWSGTIQSLTYDEPGAPQPDDAFVLAGNYPLQYGLDSAVSAERGELELAGVISGLRDRNEEVKLWGQLLCGVPDAGGCHITVTRIEAGGEVYELTAG